MTTAVIYVGSDERQADAELVLEYSVRKHASIPVEFVWMRGSDEGTPWHGWEFNWQYNKDKNNPVLNNTHWHTQFTVFRYAIPEVHGYKGRAIYMDSDMVMLKDIATLWEMPMKRPWKCISQKRTCVSLLDTGAFKDLAWWPKLKQLRSTRHSGFYYRELLAKNDFLDQTLPEWWNCADGIGFNDKTAVLHFTGVETQPWEPWKDRINYKPHKRPGLAKLWHDYHREALEAAKGEQEPRLFQTRADAPKD